MMVWTTIWLPLHCHTPLLTPESQSDLADTLWNHHGIKWQREHGGLSSTTTGLYKVPRSQQQRVNKIQGQGVSSDAPPPTFYQVWIDCNIKRKPVPSLLFFLFLSIIYCLCYYSCPNFFSPLSPSTLHTTTLQHHPLSSRPWVVYISSLASLFSIQFLISQ